MFIAAAAPPCYRFITQIALSFLPIIVCESMRAIGFKISPEITSECSLISPDGEI